MRPTKDYYEVLGVRQNAKLPEVELALKGRRTQYHPDKYAQADTETVQWATKKMQEVNEAYRILSDPIARARYDQNSFDSANADRTPHGGKAQYANAASDQETESPPCLLDYLREMPLRQSETRRIHLAPDIPWKKLNNAVACRNVFEARLPEQCLLLVDDTVFEGGADGLLITDEYISFKDMFGDSKDFRYGQIWNGNLSLQGSSVQVSGQASKSFSQVARPSLQMLVSTLNRFFSDRLAWCRRSAAQGKVQAQFALSMSIHETPQEQLRWLGLAAENGHVSAQHNLGMHFRCDNPQLAFHWFTKAAEGGSELAAERLQADIFRKFM